MSDKEHIFETDNLALCPYLQTNGLKYLRPEFRIKQKGNKEQRTVVFLFSDPKKQGKLLELDFFESSERKYRQLFLFFRNEIERIKKDFEKEVDEFAKNYK